MPLADVLPNQKFESPYYTVIKWLLSPIRLFFFQVLLTYTLIQSIRLLDTQEYNTNFSYFGRADNMENRICKTQISVLWLLWKIKRKIRICKTEISVVSFQIKKHYKYNTIFPCLESSSMGTMENNTENSYL